MPLLDILLSRKDNNPKVTSLEHPVYALSVRDKKTLVGSFIKASNDNYIQLVETGFKFPHRLPPSKVAWGPASTDGDIFASTSTSLRVWRIGDAKPLIKLYPTNKTGATSPCPMTSLSWNQLNSSKIATSSIDTTISIWDVEKGKLDTQLIAHEKSVLDVSYGNSMHQFVSVSEDGSLRLFDTRDLDHSTILYEDSAPLLRVSWGSNLISTIAAESPDVMLFDIRKSGFLVASVRLPAGLPNAMAWSPTGDLAIGASDGSIGISNSVQGDSSGQKLFPDRIIPSVVGGSMLANLAWSEDGAGLTVAYGSTLCHNVN